MDGSSRLDLFSVDGAPAGIRTRDLQLERLECLAGLHHRSSGGFMVVGVFICFPGGGVVFLSGLVGYCCWGPVAQFG